jgi:hypothetical protein
MLIKKELFSFYFLKINEKLEEKVFKKFPLHGIEPQSLLTLKPLSIPLKTCQKFSLFVRNNY